MITLEAGIRANRSGFSFRTLQVSRWWEPTLGLCHACVGKVFFVFVPTGKLKMFRLGAGWSFGWSEARCVSTRWKQSGGAS